MSLLVVDADAGFATKCKQVAGLGEGAVAILKVPDQPAEPGTAAQVWSNGGSRPAHEQVVPLHQGRRRNQAGSHDPGNEDAARRVSGGKAHLQSVQLVC